MITVIIRMRIMVRVAPRPRHRRKGKQKMGQAKSLINEIHLRAKAKERAKGQKEDATNAEEIIMYENVPFGQQRGRAKEARAKATIGTTFRKSRGRCTILGSGRRNGTIGDPKEKEKAASRAKDRRSEGNQECSLCIPHSAMYPVEASGKRNAIKEVGRIRAAAVDFGLARYRK